MLGASCPFDKEFVLAAAEQRAWEQGFPVMDLTGHSVFLFLPFPLQPSLPVLYTLSSQATHEAVHLLCRMLVFDPVSRTENHL